MKKSTKPKSKKTKKRLFVNWEAVEILYREDRLSNREICRQYAEDHKNSGAWKRTIDEKSIREKAKQQKWEKTLAGKVKKQVKENLIRKTPRNADQTLSDKDIIAIAAETGSAVILRHRKEIAKLLDHEDELLDALHNGKDKVNGKLVNIKLKDKATILKQISAVRAQRIALERQAYDLDDPANSTAQTLEDFLTEIKGS